MRIEFHRDEDFHLRTETPCSRCSLCGNLFELSTVTALLCEGGETGEAVGDVCPECAALAGDDPQRLARRIHSHASRLRSMADELQTLATETIIVDPEVHPDPDV